MSTLFWLVTWSMILKLWQIVSQHKLLCSFISSFCVEQLVRQIGEKRLFQEGKHWQELENGSFIIRFKWWSKTTSPQTWCLAKNKIAFPLRSLSHNFFGREKGFHKFSRWFSRYACIPSPDTQETFSESQTLCDRGGCHGHRLVVRVFSELPWQASGWPHNPNAEGMVSTSCSRTKIPPASGHGQNQKKILP